MRWFCLSCLLLLLGIPGGVHAQSRGLNIVSNYSPLNRNRAPRSSTEFIILHTTEGGGAGSLEHIRRFGLAHFMVDVDGKVTRTIERHRIATHAGRSMWNGRTNLDNHSIGIEVVGFHDRPLTPAQIVALRELLRQLKSIYRVPDNRILPHAMVAYGAPNRWHPVPHRGRKRCGMLMAREDVRAQLGLHDKPRFDPDVRAGRLAVADPYLERVLFAPSASPAARMDPEPAAGNVIARNRSAWDIARERYNAAGTLYEFPDGRVMRGNEITNWNRMPPGTVVRFADEVAAAAGRESERAQVLGQDAASPQELAGDASLSVTTWYFTPDGRILNGGDLTPELLAALPEGTQILVGYVRAGIISSRSSAFDLVGPRWNLPTTFYRFPDGSLRPGDAINERNIPNQTVIFFQP